VDGKSDKCQDSDDDFGSVDGAHEGPLKWVLNRNKPFECVGDREPNAEAGKDGATVYHSLAEALPIEEVDPDLVQPGDQWGKKESKIGQSQSRQIVR